MPSLRGHLSKLPEYANSGRSSRLQSLYADFSRQKASNPTSYYSNIEWWRNTLESAVSEGWMDANDTSSDVIPDRIVLNVDDSLVESFRWDGVGKPAGLKGIVTELSTPAARKPPRLIRMTDFLKSTRSIYDTGTLAGRVAAFMIGRPLWWALGQLSLVESSDAATGGNLMWKDVKGEYVLVDILEKAADAVIASHRKNSNVTLADSLYDLRTFHATYSTVALPGQTLSRKDMKVIIKYLERDKRLLVTEREVIKVIPESALAEEGADEVSAVDHGVLEMKLAVEKLETQVDDVQRKIDERTKQIQECLRSKRKEQARSYLRSKKALEELLPKRLRSLETIQSTLDQVESARSNIQIMKAYSTSTATLRALLSHPSLQKENVEKTLESMAEANEEYKEIDDIIRIGMDQGMESAGIVVDEDELANELEALVKEREEEERVEREKREKEAEEREREMEELRKNATKAGSIRPEAEATPTPQSDATKTGTSVGEGRQSGSEAPQTEKRIQETREGMNEGVKPMQLEA